MSAEEIFAPAAGRRVLFVTTKNIDYLRNTQEIAALRRVARSVTVLGFADGSYLARLARLYARLAVMPLRRYDMIFVGFAPQLVLPLFGWRFRRKTVWVDFFISFYDTLVNDRKRFGPSGLPARLLLAADRASVRRCERVIADTRADAAYFVREFGADPGRIRVLYLQADTRIFYPRAAAGPRGPAEFRVLYFGSILPLQGVGIILECARLLQGEKGVLFDLVGPVPAAMLERYRLENVRFTPWLTQEELAGRIAQADLCLAGHFCRDIDKASRTIPGKAFIYQAMDKPMILGDNPANRERFPEDSRRCFYVEMGDAPALREKILLVRSLRDAGKI